MEIGRILDITRDSRASEGDSYIIDSPCRSLRLQTGFFSLFTNASRLQQLLNNNSVSSLYLYDVIIELSASTVLSQAIAANGFLVRSSEFRCDNRRFCGFEFIDFFESGLQYTSTVNSLVSVPLRRYQS